MNISSRNSSPQFRNLAGKPKQSPIEIKQKIRLKYKIKVQDCRSILLDKFRESFNQEELCNTLTDLYKDVAKYSGETDDIEDTFIEEFKKEIVQEELEWWLKEYETSQMENYDWSSIEEDRVVCPVCQKHNFKIELNGLSCSNCNIIIKTSMLATEIKKSILAAVDNHNQLCCNLVQFSAVKEITETHIYLICDKCNEMIFVL